MKIVIAADHRGFELKESIIASPLFFDVEFVDAGAHHYDEDDDYTKRAADGVIAMTNHSIERAIVLCGSGVGMCVMANKFNGIRCGVGVTHEQVMSARTDDDMNVLAIAADYTEPGEVMKMIRVFIDTLFETSPRFERRLDDIVKQEQE